MMITVVVYNMYQFPMGKIEEKEKILSKPTFKVSIPRGQG